MGDNMRVLIALGYDVPNSTNDVPRVPKYVPRWGTTSNHFEMGSQIN